MNGTVFIAWVTNRDLARPVAEKLREKGYAVTIGGEESNPSQKNFYLGPQILNQLNHAQRAIILAQSPPKESNYNKSKGTTSQIFSPNLMLEWGYLYARLLPAYLHIFLIGIQRKDLPSDLLGAWSEEIKLGKINKMAEDITKSFLKKVKQIRIDPVDVMQDWYRWKSWMIRQKTGEEAPDSVRVAATMIHSIQPAFYYDEIDFLISYIADIKISEETSPELYRSRELVASVCEYYKLTVDPTRIPVLGALISLSESLDSRPSDINIANNLGAWIDVIRNNFLGLCHRRMAESPERRNFKDEHLQKALISLKSASDLLEKMSKEVKDSCWYIWQGYVHRNLGRVYSELNKKTEGLKALRKALSARKKAYTGLQARNVPEQLLRQIGLEIVLSKIDLLKHGDEETANMLNEVVAMLKSNKPSIRPLVLWRRAIVQAMDIAEKFKEKEVLGNLTELDERYRVEIL